MTAIKGLSKLPSPSLIFDADQIEKNLDLMLKMAGGNPGCLRPHIKTHKCAEILTLQLDRGINQVKCATIAEAELAARTGVPNILLAYPQVGQNAERWVKLSAQFPKLCLSTIVDSFEGLHAFPTDHPDQLPIYLDLDCGMHRTGVTPGEMAIRLVKEIIESPRHSFAGIHAYDGHIHDSDTRDRRQAFDQSIALLDGFIADLKEEGINPPAIVTGGSPTFAFHVERACQSPNWQCSPGTPLLWDAGYQFHFPDLPFEPAAFLMTRVVSKPGKDLICLDLGHKAVSAENPIENRVRFPSLAKPEFVSQSEEHLVVKTSESDSPAIGTELIGVPFHVCPTVALHQSAKVVRKGVLTGDSWLIEARSRVLTI